MANLVNANAGIRPPVLPENMAPSIVEHMNSVGEFAVWYLRYTIGEGHRYEYSSYGAFDTYLNALFPRDNYFVTKPQAIIRKTIAPDEDSSFSSTGGPVQSRTVGGHEADTFIVDFSVTKIIPSLPGDPINHPLVLFEIKRDWNTFADSEDQLINYLRRQNTHWYSPRSLRGVLAAGKKVQCYKINPDGAVDTIWPGVFDMFEGDPHTGVDRLTSFLAQIAVVNWGPEVAVLDEYPPIPFLP
ncbi:hypothetical protein OF83DRAFT_1285552 [Amylostereum chailletii]|nr:hypothetical protein OF83DRAFT_1285552 [Amylostereum chailletii]